MKTASSALACILILFTMVGCLQIHSAETSKKPPTTATVPIKATEPTTNATTTETSPETTTEPKETTEIETSAVGYRKQLGEFSLTFYVPDEQWGYQTYSGEKAQHLQSCAVDKSVIPIGSTIEVVGENGQSLILRCNDIGGGIKGNKLDIFWDAPNNGGTAAGYEWMAEFGTVHNVYLIEE